MLNILHLFNNFYKAFGLKNQFFPQYNDGIFFYVGLVSIILPIIIAALYYKVANGFKGFNKLRKSSHWYLFLGLNMVIVALFTLLVSKSHTQLGSFDPFMYALAIFNILLTGLIFFIASLWLKRYSLHASLKPCKWTPFRN